MKDFVASNDLKKAYHNVIVLISHLSLPTVVSELNHYTLNRSKIVVIQVNVENTQNVDLSIVHSEFFHMISYFLLS